MSTGNNFIQKHLVGLRLTVLIVGLIGLLVFVWFIFSAGSPLNADDNVTGNIENQVRDLVFVPEEEPVQSVLFINSEEALTELRDSTSSSVLRDAEIGDYYVAFNRRGVVYRPNTDQVISVFVVN